MGNLLPFATIAVGFVFALRRLDDYDTWWHLASGRWIFDNRTIPATDTLSFTVPDHPWINLQWLYDLVLYLLYSIGGANLLVLTAAAAFTTALWLMMKNLRLWVDEVSASVLCLWVILIAEERFLIRPEMVSFVLLQALLWILMTARDNEGRRLWMLIPVMLLWVNSHSLFIIGLMCIFLAVAGVLTARIPLMPRGWRKGSSLGPTADRRLLVFAAAAAAVTLVNPYFLDGLLFPFKLMSRFDVANEAFQAIGEFRRPFSSFFPTFSISAYQVFFFLSIAVVCIAAAIGLGGSRKEGSLDRRAESRVQPGLALDLRGPRLSVLPCSSQYGAVCHGCRADRRRMPGTDQEQDAGAMAGCGPEDGSGEQAGPAHGMPGPHRRCGDEHLLPPGRYRP